MNPETYRDMHLLNEVTHSPDATQRDLAKRIGVALGLTNLMLRRLAKKGYIKIVNVKRSRLRYLITPNGVMEKARLTREYLEYSLFFYRHVRGFLHEELRRMIQSGQRRVVLLGTGELAEIAFLTINELGLELAGVVDEPRQHERFLGFPVQELGVVPTLEYDRIIVTSVHAAAEGLAWLRALGVPMQRVIVPPLPGLQGLAPATTAAEESRAIGSKTPEPPVPHEVGVVEPDVAVTPSG